MTAYAIGDIQGCYRGLCQLLDKLAPTQEDQLWFCGDLINRGQDNVSTLRLLRELGQQARCVLGNHDLHALAVHYGLRPAHRSDTLEDLLQAQDRDDLFNWLRQQPLLVKDPQLKFCMVHAGIAPHWDIDTAEQAAKDLSEALRGEFPETFLQTIYGNQPNHWQQVHTIEEKYRYAFNVLTRMRYLDAQGGLDFQYKGATAPQGLTPWFAYPRQEPLSYRVVFGHWSSIGGQSLGPQFFALDTGCIWGGQLSALNLQTLALTQVSCA
jgi:bis(5'-nucleosyl)-tetraphosphatase (symmetrical)